MLLFSTGSELAEPPRNGVAAQLINDQLPLALTALTAALQTLSSALL